MVGYADVQVNLKDINGNAPLFPHGVYFGNVTENGTAGMVVMTMTAVFYDDPNEGSNAKLTYSIEKNVIDENTGMPIFEIESETGVIKTAVSGFDLETDSRLFHSSRRYGRRRPQRYGFTFCFSRRATHFKKCKKICSGTGTASIRVKYINDMPPQFTKSEW